MTTQLGNGDGTFGPERRTDVFSYTRFAHAAAADIDGDGNADVVLGTTVLLGDGTGGFDGYARFPIAGATGGLALGDADENGSPDLFVTAHSAINVLLTNTGDSLGLPLTATMGAVQSPAALGSIVPVTAQVDESTHFAADGAVMFARDGVITAFAETHLGNAATTMLILTAGTLPLTAIYSGDARYAATTSDPVSLTVPKGTPNVTWSIAPATPNTISSTSLSFNVTGVQNAVMPNGAVTLTLDGVTLSPGTAPSGTRDLGVLTGGAHTLVLTFAGDANYVAAGPYSIPLNVARVPVTISVHAAPGFSSSYGGSVLLTALVNVSYGTVKFYDGATLLGQSSVSVDRAKLTVSNLAVGEHQFVARYVENDVYATTSSAPLQYVIGDVPPAPGPTALYLVTPCRIIDTRDPNGAFGGPALVEMRSVQITGRCGIPAGAHAVAMNITVVSPTTSGYVAVVPNTNEVSGTSTMNYRPGKTRANNAVVTLSGGGLVKVFNSVSTPVHFILDVTGYFK